MLTRAVDRDTRGDLEPRRVGHGGDSQAGGDPPAVEVGAVGLLQRLVVLREIDQRLPVLDGCEGIGFFVIARPR